MAHTKYQESEIDILNQDCLAHIFGFLSMKEKIKVERVCRKWQAASKASWITFQQFEVTHKALDNYFIYMNHLTDILSRSGSFLRIFKFLEYKTAELQKILALISKYAPNINSLKGYICMKGIDMSKQLKNLHNVTKLSLQFEDISFSARQEQLLSSLFIKFSKLNYLRLKYSLITGKYLCNLPQSIHTIVLNNCSYIDSENLVKCLPNLPNLKTFKCINYVPAALPALIKCKNIEELYLTLFDDSWDFPKMDEAERLLMVLANNKNIKTLYLSHFMLKNKFVYYLPETLETLSIFDCTYSNDNNLYNYSFSLPTLNKLTVLEIDDVDFIDDEFASIFGQCPNLNLFSYYNIPSASITDRSTKYLSALVNLEKLIIVDNAAINDDFLKVIGSNCKKLFFLDISSCESVTDDGLQAIISLAKLEILEIRGLNKITDMPFFKIINVKVFNCSYCPNVQNDGICYLLKTATKLEAVEVSKCGVTDEIIIDCALAAAKNRKNGKALKLYMESSDYDVNKLKNESQYLELITESQMTTLECRWRSNYK